MSQTNHMLAGSFRRSRSQPDLAAAIAAAMGQPHCAILESAAPDRSSGCYTIVGFEPVEIIRTMADDENPFDELGHRLAQVRPAIESRLPYSGGYIGYLAYESGRHIEHLPRQAKNDLELPTAWFGLYDTLAVFEHDTNQWWVSALESSAALPVQERLDNMEQFLARANRTAQPDYSDHESCILRMSLDETAHADAVGRILEHIRAGDIYQANLTVRFDCPPCHPPAVYDRMRKTNPANYFAYVDCGDHQILSSSPELFLSCRDGQALTRPIKGTCRRSIDVVEDHKQQVALRRSEKDLAELAMIVDLERNDLNRVCHSVRALWPPALESYATVHHLVADVSGHLRDSSCTVVDLLRATFPGGSITGAPKIRAMQIIDSIEPVVRGPYCGAIGYLGLNDSTVLNVAIRTIVVSAYGTHVHAGGGIVADSKPDQEYAELMAKAEGMFRALGIPGHMETKS